MSSLTVVNEGLSLTVVNEGLSLTVVKEGSSLTIVNEGSFSKTTVLKNEKLSFLKTIV